MKNNFKFFKENYKVNLEEAMKTGKLDISIGHGNGLVYDNATLKNAISLENRKSFADTFKDSFLISLTLGNTCIELQSFANDNDIEIDLGMYYFDRDSKDEEWYNHGFTNQTTEEIEKAINEDRLYEFMLKCLLDFAMVNGSIWSMDASESAMHNLFIKEASVVKSFIFSNEMYAPVKGDISKEDRFKRATALSEECLLNHTPCFRALPFDTDGWIPERALSDLFKVDSSDSHLTITCNVCGATVYSEEKAKNICSFEDEYLQNVTNTILNKFEALLDSKGVVIPSSDRDGKEDEACLFGEDYYNLEHFIMETMREKFIKTTILKDEKGNLIEN